MRESMRDPFASGKRLARRLLWAQGLAGLTLALVLGAWQGSWSMAAAVAFGAAAVLAGHAVFARRQFAGPASVAGMTRRFFGAAAWKWLVLFGFFGVGLIVLGLPAGGLLAGLIAAQLAGLWALLRHG